MADWITGPAAPMYATPAQVAAALPNLGGAPDLADLIAACSRKIDDECRRSFPAADLVEAIDGGGTPKIWLSQTPVNSVASVTMNGQALDDSDGSGWSFHPGRGTLVRGSSYSDPRWLPAWPRGTGNIVVAYNGGYAAVPPPIVRATLILIKHVRDLTRSTGAFRSESLGDYSYTLAAIDGDGLPPLVRSLIGPYVMDPIS